MTAEDLDRIERVLGRRLPEDYREVMQRYPFSPGSFSYDCMLTDDARTVIEANREPHDILRDGPPTLDYLWIGSDGGEEYYFLDLRGSPCPFYAYDLETGEQTDAFADDIDDYIRKCKEMDRQIEEDEQSSGEKRWWQFWR